MGGGRNDKSQQECGKGEKEAKQKEDRTEEKETSDDFDGRGDGIRGYDGGNRRRDLQSGDRKEFADGLEVEVDEPPDNDGAATT
ncbi:MAG: hypothetical protein JWQ49_2117 [Edaphobacter sp.]|nr:hypothetical protein [Edaphobacter sp.]